MPGWGLLQGDSGPHSDSDANVSVGSKEHRLFCLVLLSIDDFRLVSQQGTCSDFERYWNDSDSLAQLSLVHDAASFVGI